MPSLDLAAGASLLAGLAPAATPAPLFFGSLDSRRGVSPPVLGRAPRGEGGRADARGDSGGPAEGGAFRALSGAPVGRAGGAEPERADLPAMTA